MKSPCSAPRGVKKEQRCFTDEEVGKILAAASEPFGTTRHHSCGDLCSGGCALEKYSRFVLLTLISQRRSPVCGKVLTRSRGGSNRKSNASGADVPLPSQLEARLRKHLQNHDGKTELLFINSRGRPYSANKLRAKVLHPLLVKLGIPRGGFHSMRHGVTVLCWQTAQLRLSCRSNYVTVTHASRWESMRT